MSDERTHPKKAWTLLVFIAGDNDLESFAHLDLAEMESLPSDEHINLLVQFDSRSEATYRFRFLPGGRELAGQPLGEVNTGDPATLTRFVMWGQQHFPADQTALIIWNHGTGLRDLPADFDYSRIRSGEPKAIETELQRTLFESTLSNLARTSHHLRAIAIDATNRDYLDTQELQKALSDVPGDGPRVDLLGFDACLMSAAEIAYQLRRLARFMVGSQEVEPGTGWPYKDVLAALAAQPSMSAGHLAETIVSCYAQTTGRQLRGRESPYTQSALDLSQVDQTFDLIRDMVHGIAAPEVLNHTKVQNALRQSHKRVKRFRDRDMADLLDWCELVRRETKGRASEPFREALIALQAHLVPGDGLVMANHAHGGSDADRIHGVSIYWPQTAYSSVYDRLDFAVSGWGKLAEHAVNA